MAKRRVGSTKRKAAPSGSPSRPSRGAAVRTRYRDLSPMWKGLVVGNLFITLFTFWMIYSQNTFIINQIQDNMPIAIPNDYKGTSYVQNPITGNLVTVNSFAPVATLVGVVSLLGIYFLFKEEG